MKKPFLIIGFICITAITPAHALTPEQAGLYYQSAYPQSVRYEHGALWVKQQKLPLKASDGDFNAQLNQGELLDQLAQRYPFDFQIPACNADPGRIRSDAFFAAMYGGSEQAVRKNLVSVRWAPNGKNVQFNHINGAAQVLQAVGEEIAQHPQLAAYVAKPAGTFNYRFISGTKRRSAHAFGIAIDFTLPHGLGTYWQWSGCKADSPCAYPEKLIRDPKLKQIVGIFEKRGFIWGGKWYHYDSGHFEYRPELLQLTCR
ncbi:M15 family metallopeptidase [Aggregatibacter actinomycetemcomitans]|uniref:M15 family metallopeptidase n=1 Tax=Aggregatibacter actinomycetemcomitans TaxID=714 RepID=UPI00197C6D8B|nr:M15 family metallopeptidase [Aggregatibacter actinomycetemcomitans]MBN6074830.1 M15 family metallopeptidase [Aggregatibacter actinomycetemcomitans]